MIWVCLVGWLAFVTIWLKRLNDALGKYNALFIIPLLQANYILLAIINGGIFFQEFRGFTAGSWAMFIISLCGIFGGLFLLRPEVADDKEVDKLLEGGEMNRLAEKAKLNGIDSVKEESPEDDDERSTTISSASTLSRERRATRAKSRAVRRSVFEAAPPPSAGSKKGRKSVDRGGGGGRMKATSRASLALSNLVQNGERDNTGVLRVHRMSLASTYTQAILASEREDERMLEKGDKRRRSSLYLDDTGGVAFHKFEPKRGMLSTIESVSNMSGYTTVDGLCEDDSQAIEPYVEMQIENTI